MNMNDLAYMLEDFEFEITSQQKILVESLFAGLNRKQALARAGLSEHTNVNHMINRNPGMKQYAQFLQDQEKAKWKVTREDVTKGIKEAIEDAKMLEEPNTQINGWRELGRLHGLYAPEEKKVTLSTQAEERLRQLEESSTEDLLKMADQPVIEGDFEQLDG